MWALEAVKGEEIDLNKYNKHPNLEINLTTSSVLGNDSCNNFFGDLKTVDNNRLAFNALAGTKMACPNITLSNAIKKALAETQAYKIENLKLLLYNTKGEELLRYKKVD
nr:META domain-containing protein [Lacinutrix sp.]